MDENRSIKEVVESYKRIYNQTNSKNIKVVFEDYSYIFMTIGYILADKTLNKKYHIYNHYASHDELIIYIERDV